MGVSPTADHKEVIFMKQLYALILSVSLLLSPAFLTACSSEPQEVISTPSSLEELGYRIDEEAIPAVVLEDTQFLDENTMDPANITGGFTAISGYWHEPLGSSLYPMALLQAVPANTTKIKQHPSPIDLADWEQYRVFSDKNIIVYNVYPLYFPQGDLPSVIRKQVEESFYQTEAEYKAGNIPKEHYRSEPLMSQLSQTHYLDYLWDYYQRSIPSLIVPSKQ